MQIQKGSSSQFAIGKWTNISLFCKNGRDKKRTQGSGIFFSQSDHTYCKISAGDFRYQDRQGFQGNEKFVKRMNIKQNNISENDTAF